MLKQLLKLANKLDLYGYYREANLIDELAIKYSGKDDIYEKHNDPVKHMREDNPMFILPHNIPDYQVLEQTIEPGNTRISVTTENMEPGNMEKTHTVDGPYFVIGVNNEILTAYATSQQAIKNAEANKFCAKVLYFDRDEYGLQRNREFDPDIDIFVYSEPIWARSKDSLPQIKHGPYYIIDYWGRIIEGYSSKEQAIRNAENSEYIESVVYEPLGGIDHGQMSPPIYKKPKNRSKIQA